MRASLPNIYWVEQGVKLYNDGLLIGVSPSKPSWGLGNPDGIIRVSKQGQRVTTEHERNLFIVFVNEADSYPLDDVKISGFERHEKGGLRAGDARWVWQFVGADSGLPFRAGLTIHRGKGAWSSMPHEFEVQYMQSPKPMDFDERFFFITKPAHSWGAVVRTGHLNDRFVNDIQVVRDGDNLEIPLGFHPVTGGPSTIMAYLWAYTCSDLALMEKFEADSQH
jgi:hypothetical protein